MNELATSPTDRVVSGGPYRTLAERPRGPRWGATWRARAMVRLSQVPVFDLLTPQVHRRRMRRMERRRATDVVVEQLRQIKETDRRLEEELRIVDALQKVSRTAVSDRMCQIAEMDRRFEEKLRVAAEIEDDKERLEKGLQIIDVWQSEGRP